MLGQPQRVPAEPIHVLGDRFELVEHRDELLVGVVALVGWRGVLAEVRHVDVAGIDRHEPGDHGASLGAGGARVAGVCASIGRIAGAAAALNAR